MQIFLPILVLLFSSLSAHADQCQTLKNEPLQAGLVAKLDEARNKHIEILGFRLYDFPILITSAEVPLCVALYQQGKVEFTTLTRPLEVANGKYDFRNEHNKMSQSDEEELKFLIEDRKIGTFLIYKISKSLRDDYEELTDSLRVHFAIMVHEGFHLLSQGSLFNMAHYKSDKPYVDWTSEGRKFIKSTCYGPRKDIEDDTNLEISLLKTAIVQADIKNSQIDVANTVRKFLTVRDRRYEMLKDSKFHPESWDLAEGCPFGEAAMEYTEGTAEFVELIYLLGTDLIRIDQWINPQTNKYIGSQYYVLGSLQLLLLHKLDPQFSVLSAKIEKGGIPPAESFYTTRLRELVSQL